MLAYFSHLLTLVRYFPCRLTILFPTMAHLFCFCCYSVINLRFGGYINLPTVLRLNNVPISINKSNVYNTTASSN